MFEAAPGLNADHGESPVPEHAVHDYFGLNVIKEIVQRRIPHIHGGDRLMLPTTFVGVQLPEIYPTETGGVPIHQQSSYMTILDRFPGGEEVKQSRHPFRHHV